MKDYDVLFIVKPHLGDDKYTAIAETFKTLVTKNGGEIVQIKAWGTRDLPASFDKIRQGYYIQSEIKAVNKTLAELKHWFSVTEDIIREMVVTLESVTPHPKKLGLKSEG